MSKAGVRGSRVRVRVDKPDRPDKEKLLEEKLRTLLLRRTVTSVDLVGEQLVVGLHDGGRLSLNYPGGIRETS